MQKTDSKESLNHKNNDETEPMEYFLNDDCVESILRLLPLTDLFSTALVSKQFKRVTLRVFKYKFKGKFELPKNDKTMNMTKLCKIFDVFGKEMTEIKMSPSFCHWTDEYSQQDIIEQIVIKCNQKNNKLKTLKLSHFWSIHRAFDLLKNFFKTLENIDLIHVTIPGTILNMLMQFTSAKRINFYLCTAAYYIDTIYIPKVNENLQILDIRCSQLLYVYDLLIVVHKSFPNLKQFSFHVVGPTHMNGESRNNLLNIAKLKNLQHLSINVGYYSLDKIFEKLATNKIPLITLKFTNALVYENTVYYISKMENLQELYCFSGFGFTIDDLHQLVESLKYLKILSCVSTLMSVEEMIRIIEKTSTLQHGEFRLGNDQYFNRNNHLNLVNVIKRRPEKNTLRLTIHRSGLFPFYREEKQLLDKETNNPLLSIDRILRTYNSIFW